MLQSGGQEALRDTELFTGRCPLSCMIFNIYRFKEATDSSYRGQLKSANFNMLLFAATDQGVLLGVSGGSAPL